MAEKFMGYTVGLMATHSNVDRPKLVKVEYTRASNGKVRLTAVSGQNLASLGRPSVEIEEDAYQDRPIDPVDKVPEAIWAFSLLGWSVSS